ncbi:hypothetical protein [Endozoicomonas sp. Mp262]|uniref:hypothetical protein n=1 Tax=Endozoicomonas sp. Mp262 TaxID=2919499 RepID=UPI0021E05164
MTKKTNPFFLFFILLININVEAVEIDRKNSNNKSIKVILDNGISMTFQPESLDRATSLDKNKVEKSHHFLESMLAYETVDSTQKPHLFILTPSGLFRFHMLMIGVYHPIPDKIFSLHEYHSYVQNNYIVYRDPSNHKENLEFYVTKWLEHSSQGTMEKQ